MCNGSRSICNFQLVQVQISAVSKHFFNMYLTAIIVVSQSIATGNIYFISMLKVESAWEKNMRARI